MKIIPGIHQRSFGQQGSQIVLCQCREEKKEGDEGGGTGGGGGHRDDQLRHGLYEKATLAK